ncbi:hypothetical protein PFISCL1PPCAC_4598, partial [Pristionchus fissidentatus]
PPRVLLRSGHGQLFLKCVFGKNIAEFISDYTFHACIVRQPICGKIVLHLSFVHDIDENGSHPHTAVRNSRKHLPVCRSRKEVFGIGEHVVDSEVEAVVNTLAI